MDHKITWWGEYPVRIVKPSWCKSRILKSTKLWDDTFQTQMLEQYEPLDSLGWNGEH